MSRWYDHPCSNKLLEGEQVLNVLSFLNESKDSYKEIYGDINSKTSPLDKILKMWPDKSSVKKEWLRKVVDSGPMNDKMQSMVTIISQFPMYSFFYLDELISLVNINKKRFAITASELLTELFATFLLPSNRPLLNLKERPLVSLNSLSDEKAKRKGRTPPKTIILTYWYFEEQLKTRYIRFLKALEEMLKIEVDKANKLRMLSLFARLCKKKESQSIIVEILINKLGDNDKKVIGSALSKLKDLEKEFKSLVPIVVRTICKFVFRPNLSSTAQYYAIQLLASTKFDVKRLESAPMNVDDDQELKNTDLAVEVVQIYVGVLKRLMEASKTKCEKLYSAIMCGISRVLPYAKDADVKKYTDSIFKLAHSSNLNLSIQGLKVLFVIVKSKQTSGAEDCEKTLNRYQRLVYRLLLNPAIFFNSQKTKLVEIFFKSVAIDTDVLRAKTMIKRLLQLCIQIGDPGFICVCLLFLSKLTASKLSDIFKIKVKQSCEKIDHKVPTIPMAEAISGEGDSDDEVVPDITSDNDDDSEIVEVAEEVVNTPMSSWVHVDNIKLNNKTVHYDPFTLDPKFANADKEELIELNLLKNHFHPTVKLFAEKIQKREKIVYKSDPSEDFSLAKFLDRFAFRNPKEMRDKRKVMPGSSKQELDPARKVAVNSKQYVDMSESNVPIDELFFHKFFTHSKIKTKRTTRDGGEEEDLDDELSVCGSDEDVDDDGSFVEDDDEMMDFDDESMDDMDMGGLEDSDDEDVDVDEMGGGEDESDAEVVFEDADMSDENDEATIHSSKRRRLGQELSSITTGAMATGNMFEAVQKKFESTRKHDRKVRKGKKPKKVKEQKVPEMKTKKKNLKRKFKN